MRLPRRLATLAATALAAASAAQTPPTVYVEVRDPSNQRVAGAEGWLLTEPRWRLPALDGAPASPSAGLPRPLALRATSDANGTLRFRAPDGEPLFAGAGMVRTAEGLGALLPRRFAGGAVRLMLQPLGAVTTATGSEPFTLWARTRLADGTVLPLPPQSGREVRLPAGDYEVWAHGEEGWIWSRVQVAAGSRTTLNFLGEGQRLQLPPRAALFPAGRPELTLQDEQGAALLRATALAAPLVVLQDGRLSPPHQVPGPIAPGVRPWPPRDGVAADAGDELPLRMAGPAPAGAVLFGVVVVDDAFRVTLALPLDDAAPRLPEPPEGDAWLVVVAPDAAPVAAPWSTIAAGAALAMPGRGVPLRVTARDDSGRAAPDVAFEFLPAGLAPARKTARSDALGRADFGPVSAPGVLRVSDPRFRNAELALDRVPAEGMTLDLDVGATCSGVVRFVDHRGEGTEADGDTVVLTLRDPRGELRPASRTAVLAPGGTFTFAGLPDHGSYRLFAAAQRDGRRWSAEATVAIGGDDVELLLEHEDPDLRREMRERLRREQTDR
ncbi:MAG: hypothetical protein H6835_12295 [Planctomycetes bacterium]|nr:hypothetical protein [Planctomycetota bacterium]